MSNDNLIGSDAALTPAQEQTLRRILGSMIPASTEHNVPGADDDAIVADVLIAGGPALPLLAGALDALAGYERVDELVSTLRREHSEAAGLLMALTAQCYYRDDRVMASLDMEPRAPFPQGYEVADGDWSLLEPVRARGRIYREAPG